MLRLHRKRKQVLTAVDTHNSTKEYNFLQKHYLLNNFLLIFLNM